MIGITKYLIVGLSIALAGLFMYCSYLRSDRASVIDDLNSANNTIAGLNAFIEKTKEQLLVIRKIDSNYQEQLKNAQTENDKLRDSLANGVKRLYVKTDCPVSTHTTSTSQPNAATSRLTEDARQDYLRLRLEIEQTKQQVLGLQNYIKLFLYL